eukprot:3307838-Rhodomonas_salina.2
MSTRPQGSRCAAVEIQHMQPPSDYALTTQCPVLRLTMSYAMSSTDIGIRSGGEGGRRYGEVTLAGASGAES